MIFSINNIIKYYFYALVVAPLSVFISFEYFNQDFSKLYGSLAVVIAIFKISLERIRDLKFRNYLIPLILLYLLYLVWDIVLNQGDIERKGFVYDFFFTNITLHTISVLFLIDNYRFDEKFIKNIITIFKITVIVALVISIIQFIYDPLFFTPQKFREYMVRKQWGMYEVRRLSLFGYLSNNDVGLSFIPILTLLIGYIAKINKKIPYIYVLAGIFIAFATNSRYIQVSYFLCLIPLFFIGKKVLRNMLIGIFSIPILIFIVLQVFRMAGLDISTYINERLLDESALSRFLSIKIFLKFFHENPYFGTGQHLTSEVSVALAHQSSQIHIGYLSHLFSYGIVGSFFLFWIWTLVMKRFSKTALRTGFNGSLIAFITFLWANVSIVYYYIFTYGLIFCFVFNKYFEDKIEKHER